MASIQPVRDVLHETIQNTVEIDEELPEGSMLIGWVTVAEWMAPDGQRWLSSLDGGSSGKACPDWQRQGYLHNALFDADSFIPDPEGDDG